MSADVWVRGFDNDEPRSVERQLCLMRDSAQRLAKANKDGDPGLIRDCTREVNRAVNDVDLFLSGVVHGRAGK